MIGLWQGAAGFALCVAGWVLPRRVAGAGISRAAAMVLDAAPLGAFALVVFLAGGRPILAGAMACALGGGFAFADRVVRESLREPVVFSAMSELPQVFTHPHLYLPFAGTGWVVGGFAAAMLGGVALLAVEPPVTTPHPRLAIAIAATVVVLLWRTGREPWLGAAARGLRRLRPTGEPFADAAHLGPVAMLVVHGVVARAERGARQAMLAPTPRRTTWAAARPVILVQGESFFDARRALPTLPRGFLAGYDAARARGGYGRLDVSAWGANSTRAEFAVLTGIEEAALGYDRFNPYHALTRVPIASQVWRLREAGYRTICLHPFDRWFYRRDRVMPALGFERFLGREVLGGSRAPPYASDLDLARHILRVLDAEGPRVFIFAITMGNHGPWLGEAPRLDPALADLIDEETPQCAELARYLDGLRRSDAMLSLLIDRLERRRDGALLGFYGDHLPSLPRAFAHLGFDDWRSDYVIWSESNGPAGRCDLAAHALGRVVADLALAPIPAFDSVVREPHDA